jgi:hypothetical protein
VNPTRAETKEKTKKKHEAKHAEQLKRQIAKCQFGAENPQRIERNWNALNLWRIIEHKCSHTLFFVSSFFSRCVSPSCSSLTNFSLSQIAIRSKLLPIVQKMPIKPCLLLV